MLPLECNPVDPNILRVLSVIPNTVPDENCTNFPVPQSIVPLPSSSNDTDPDVSNVSIKGNVIYRNGEFVSEIVVSSFVIGL